ncbi:hypothetical protein [Thalassobium sp. R2A62]|uniref:hypothetical protein n=1 Tax=Thalassobium sp. R2A62 TaxID=633131 RepID=UPI000592FD40|nr:hypothetical protein [Thalassobium sp. R2A62]
MNGAKALPGVKDAFHNFVLVNILYVVSCALTLGFVFPLQSMLLGSSLLDIGLLYLPHGVRVLAFYFFGWQAIFYLLPASYLFLALSNSAGTDLDIMTPVVSMIACYLGYKAATFIPLFRNRALSPGLWKFLIFSGASSSLANGIALSFLQHQGAELLSVIGYMIGDVFGLCACFVILMYLFRFARLLAKAHDA